MKNSSSFVFQKWFWTGKLNSIALYLQKWQQLLQLVNWHCLRWRMGGKIGPSGCISPLDGCSTYPPFACGFFLSPYQHNIIDLAAHYTTACASMIHICINRIIWIDGHSTSCFVSDTLNRFYIGDTSAIRNTFMACNFLHSNAGGLNTETIRGSLFFGPPLRSPDLEGHILGF